MAFFSFALLTGWKAGRGFLVVSSPSWDPASHGLLPAHIWPFFLVYPVSSCPARSGSCSQLFLRRVGLGPPRRFLPQPLQNFSFHHFKYIRHRVHILCLGFFLSVEQSVSDKEMWCGLQLAASSVLWMRRTNSHVLQKPCGVKGTTFWVRQLLTLAFLGALPQGRSSSLSDRKGQPIDNIQRTIRAYSEPGSVS